MLAYATLFVIITESVFHAIIAMANPSDANLVGDERDKSIANKATSAAYGILFTGVIIVIVHLLLFEYFLKFRQILAFRSLFYLHIF
jgi:hypothetical protein